MPQCCRCNGKSTCSNCICKKSGQKCFGCLPSCRDRCQNSCRVVSATDEDTSMPSSSPSAEHFPNQSDVLTTQTVTTSQLDIHNFPVSFSQPAIPNQPVFSSQPAIPNQPVSSSNPVIPSKPVSYSQTDPLEPATSIESDEILPTFAKSQKPNFRWGDLSNEEAIKSIDILYIQCFPQTKIKGGMYQIKSII